MRRYTAKQLPVHKGPAAWNEILGSQSPPNCLEKNLTTDFVIIGGGFAGLSAARRLAQLAPKSTIMLLEAGRIAEAASGRNSGFMIDLPHDLASDDYAGSGDDQMITELNRVAIQFGEEAVQEYNIDPNYFEVAGKINGAASGRATDHNKSYAEHLSNLGEAHEILDQKQMLEITGSPHYASGLYTPGTVMLQPAGYVRGLAKGLSRNIAIYENSPVTSFERTGQTWRVNTPTGSANTPKIILANNGHLQSFGFVQRRLMQLFLFASMTPELDPATLAILGGQSRWGITPSDPMGTTMRRIDTGQGGNRIVTRTCAKVRPNLIPRDNDVKSSAIVHQRKFDRRFPQLAGLKMQYRWAGHLCLSLNGVAMMKEIEDGVFSACVQNGLGTTRGTLTGIGAAELACGVTSKITDFFTNEGRPKKLPPEPFASMGANSYMRWKEWRASDE